MPSSLHRKVLIPLGITFTLLLGLAGAQYQNFRTHDAAYSDLSSQQLSLLRGFDVLQERHTRFSKRVREALIKPIGLERDTALAWAADGYVRNIEPVLADLESLLSALKMRTKSDQFTRDLERLSNQIEIIQVSAQDLGTVFPELLPKANTDAEDTAEATLDSISLPMLESFHRTDALFISQIQQAKAIATRVTSRRLKELHLLAFSISPGWTILLLWLPLCLWLVIAPLRALSALASQSNQGSAPLTKEEAALRTLFQALNSKAAELASKLAEHERDSNRWSNASRRAETELALLRIYNENLVDSLRSAIVVTDSTGQVTSFNRTAKAMLGISDAALQTPVQQTNLFNALEQRTKSAAKSLTSALEKQSVTRFEGIELRTGSLEKLLDVRLVPYVDESGAARGVLWVADDITESGQMKNQLLASEHMAAVGRISAQVAHEIRNPLSAIGLNAELLEEDFATRLPESRRPEALDLLRAIAREIERLNEITEGYLQLARMPSPKFRETDLNALISDLTSMFGQELKAHQIDVQLNLEPSTPLARVDPGQIRQALINIIRNSIEAISGPGTISVGTETNTDTCSITLTDTGPGLPASETQRAFEPFFTTKPAGTGLGLSLTQQILEDNGGTISLTNVSSGGAQVHIVLPKLQAPH